MGRLCIDCGNPVSGNSAKRCKSCYTLYQQTNLNYKQKAGAAMSLAARNNPSLCKFRSDMMKRVNTPELKAKKSEIAKRMWGNPETKNKMLEGIYTTGKFGYVGSSVSKLETKVMEYLIELGLTITPQYHPAGFCRLYDMLVPDLDLLIEVDGYYWHHSEWAIADGRELIDDIKNVWALSNGYSLIRFREDDLEAIGFQRHINNGLNALLNWVGEPALLWYRCDDWLCDPASDVVTTYSCAFTSVSDMIA